MTLVFDSYLAAAAFAFVLVAGFVANALITRRTTRPSRRARRRQGDRRTSTAVNAANAGSFLVSLLFGYLRIASLPEPFFVAGMVVFLLGLGLTIWAELVLGRFYAPIVEAQEGHRVVDRGPYRLIRHPIYAGAIVAFLGIALALQSAAAVLAALVLNGLAYAYRIRVEERFLKAELGEAYAAYCARTKRIIPFLL